MLKKLRAGAKQAEGYGQKIIKYITKVIDTDG